MTQQEKNTGHHARLREQFLADPATLSETETLELLLTYAIPRRDVASLAQALIDRFGSADCVLTASCDELIAVPGIGEQATILIKVVAQLASQAAIAIENAQLFEEATKRAEGIAFANELGRLLSATRDVKEIPRLLVKETLKEFNAEAGSLALINAETQEIEFRFALDYRGTEGLETMKGYKMPLDKSIAGAVVQGGEPVISNNVQKDPRWHKEVDSVTGFTAKSILAVPLIYGSQVIGVIEILNKRDESPFLEREKDILTALALSAAIAIEDAKLYEHISQNLERRIQELEVLTEMSRGAVSDLGIDQILDLVYEHMAKIMNLSDAQVRIAFYDEAKDEVSFPLAIEQDAGEIIDIVRWGKREAQYRGGDEEEEVVEQLKPRWRRDPPGLTEYVIRTKQPLLIVEDFEQKATNLGIKVWPTSGRLDRPTHSWLGVPMIVGGRVIGVISIQSPEQERAFDEGQQVLLAAVANQAAVTIENAALFEEKDQALGALREEQRKNLAAGRLAAVNTVVAEFMHRMNNIAGTIPVRVEQIRELLDPSDERHPRISHFLDAISDDVEIVLRTASAIRSSDLAEENLELVNIDTLVSTAIQRIAIPSEVTINNQCTRGLPQVLAFSGQLVDTLENIIRNGLEAIEGAGTVTISCRKAVKDSQEWVAIEVKDTGRGIPAEDLSKIFGLFFTTKPNGMGFALWRTRTLVESLGGSVTVSSKVGKGTAFTILLPVA